MSENASQKAEQNELTKLFFCKQTAVKMFKRRDETMGCSEKVDDEFPFVQ
jgi:hypothetical protein